MIICSHYIQLSRSWTISFNMAAVSLVPEETGAGSSVSTCLSWDRQTLNDHAVNASNFSYRKLSSVDNLLYNYRDRMHAIPTKVSKLPCWRRLIDWEIDTWRHCQNNGTMIKNQCKGCNCSSSVRTPIWLLRPSHKPCWHIRLVLPMMISSSCHRMHTVLHALSHSSIFWLTCWDEYLW